MTTSSTFLAAILLLPISLGSAAQTGSAAEIPGICIRYQGVECATPNDLFARGIRLVRFVPNPQIQTEENSRTWQAYGYSSVSGTIGSALPLLLTSLAPANGEVAALAAQEFLCQHLRPSGISCSRDTLAGRWKIYGQSGGPLQIVRFKPTELQPLTASGELTTTSWACQKHGSDQAIVEQEVMCSGTYSYSMRLLYLLNNGPGLFQVDCTAGRERVVQASELPLCPESEVYPSAQWSAIKSGNNSVVFSNAARTYLPNGQASLYLQTSAEDEDTNLSQ